MTRWLALFLVLWLPLQMAWAVAATYCQHERTQGAQHFGHHSHAHSQAQPGEGPHHAGAHGTQGLQADNDCTHCHASVSPSCVADAPEVKALVSAHPRPQSRPTRLGSAFQRPPDRPQWRGLA